MIPTGQHTADQIIEREVRELVRQRGLDPGNGDATAVRHLIDEVVADYTVRRLTASMPPLADPGQVAKTVADRVVGMSTGCRHGDRVAGRRGLDLPGTRWDLHPVGVEPGAPPARRADHHVAQHRPDDLPPLLDVGRLPGAVQVGPQPWQAC